MDDFDRAYGLKSMQLRYFNAAGADPDGEIGEDHQPETHLVPLVLDVALERRGSVNIFGGDYPTADGTPVRDYVHVCDLASAHLNALEYLLAGGATSSINLGTGQGASVATLIATTAEVIGLGITKAIRSRREGDPAQLVADPRKAERLLGWQAERSDLSMIMTDAWAWRRKRFGGQAEPHTMSARIAAQTSRPTARASG